MLCVCVCVCESGGSSIAYFISQSARQKIAGHEQTVVCRVAGLLAASERAGAQLSREQQEATEVIRLALSGDSLKLDKGM